MADSSLRPSELLTDEERNRLELIRRNPAAGFIPTLSDLDFLLELYSRLLGGAA